MQATVNYLLTQQAQRAQMVATGQPVALNQTMTIDITPEDLPLCEVSPDGTVSVSPPAHRWTLRASGWTEELPPCAPTYAPDILGDIRRGQAMLDAAYADALAITERYVADTPDVMPDRANTDYDAMVAIPDSISDSDALGWALRANGNQRCYIHTRDLSPTTRDILAERYRTDAAQRAADRQAAELVNRAKEAEKETAAAALEQAKQEAIAHYVSASGDLLLQRQHADGLLPRRDVLTMMADAACTVVGVPAACPNPTICDDHDCPCYDHSQETIPPAVYAAWRSMCSLPDGATVQFRQVRECRGDDSDERAGEIEYHAIVTIPSGPFQFTRRIQIAWPVYRIGRTINSKQAAEAEE